MGHIFFNVKKMRRTVAAFPGFFSLGCGPLPGRIEAVRGFGVDREKDQLCDKRFAAGKQMKRKGILLLRWEWATRLTLDLLLCGLNLYSLRLLAGRLGSLLLLNAALSDGSGLGLY